MFVNFVSAVIFLILGYLLVFQSESFMEFEDYMQVKIWKRPIEKNKDIDKRIASIRRVGKIFATVGIIALIIAIVQVFTL